MDKLEKHYKGIIFIAIAFIAIVSVKLANDDALIYDEISHISAGYSYISKLDYRINPEHPPLIKVLSGVPLFLLDLTYDTNLEFWNKFSGLEYDQWAAGKHFLHLAGNDIDKIALFSRLPVILISVLLAVMLFKWGRKRGGITTGVFVLLLFAFDPNVLGHNHFVTTDIGAATGIILAFYFFLKFLRKNTWRNVAILGVTLGVAQVIKFSSLLLLPFFVFLTVIFITLKLFQSRKDWIKNITQYLVKIATAFLIMFFVISIVYIPLTYQMPDKILSQTAPAQIHINDGKLDECALEFVLWANKNASTRFVGVYVQGVFQVKNRVKYGNELYYIRQVSKKAFLSYFPVVFVIKQTLPHMFFYICTIAIFIFFIFKNIRRGIKQGGTIFFPKMRDYLLLNFTEVSWILFILFYAYISITGNLNIGFRHLFPMMPFVYLITARICVSGYNELVNKRKIIIAKYIFIGGVLLMVTETILAFPFYLSYFNQAVGGSKNGYKLVTDSNADWGQDLKRLENYLDDHPEINKLRIDYFGGGAPENRLGNKIEIIRWYENTRPIKPGYYAISVNSLQGSIYDARKTKENSYRWTLKYKPIAQVGTSILIYKVTK